MSDWTPVGKFEKPSTYVIGEGSEYGEAQMVRIDESSQRYVRREDYDALLTAYNAARGVIDTDKIDANAADLKRDNYRYMMIERRLREYLQTFGNMDADTLALHILQILNSSPPTGDAFTERPFAGSVVGRPGDIPKILDAATGKLVEYKDASCPDSGTLEAIVIAVDANGDLTS